MLIGGMLKISWSCVYSKCFRGLFGLTVCFFFWGGGAEHKEFGWLKDMVDRRQFIGARTFVKLINHFRLKFPGAIATWERKIVKVYATKHWLVGMCSWHLLTLELWMIIYIYQASDKDIWIQLQPDVACDQSMINQLYDSVSAISHKKIYQSLHVKQLDLEKLPTLAVAFGGPPRCSKWPRR